MSTFLAVDFGAGSGRVIAGRVSGGQLGLDELHRFPNRQVRLGGHVYWDFPALFEEMKEGPSMPMWKASASTRGVWTTGWWTGPAI